MSTITTLTLENFRNHRHATIVFKPLTVVLGGKGVGKTSIIEAIRILSLGKSFRARRNNEIITFDAPAVRIIATTAHNNKMTKIVCALTHDKKKITLNGATHPFSHIIGSIRQFYSRLMTLIL